MAVSTVEYSGNDAATPGRGVRTFAVMWPLQYLAGLTMSVLTLAMTIPSGAYLPFETGSALLLAVGYGLTFVSFSSASPLGGLLTDRWGPKNMLLASNAGYLVLLVISAALWAGGFLPGWLVWVILLGRVACQSVQLIALAAAIPVLIPKRTLSQANGSRMILTTSVAVFEGPIAAALYPVIGLPAIMLIVGVSLIAALAFLTRAEIPPARLPETADARPVTIRRGNKPLWAYVRSRRGLVALFGFFALFNLVVGFAEVADKAITQGFGSATTLNIVLGAGVTSMLVTSVAITIWGTPRRAVRWLIIFSVILGASLVLGATRPSLPVVAVAAVLFLGSAPFIMGIISTLLHTKTEPGLMGRMMGLQTLVIGITYGVGNVVGALCRAFSKPLIGGNRLSTGFLTTLVGTGWADGRGYALMTMIVGVLTIVVVLLLGRRPSLRYLETNLPDVTAEDLLRRHAPLEPRHNGIQQQAAHRPAEAAPRPSAGEPSR